MQVGTVAIGGGGYRCAAYGAVEVRTAVLETKARDDQITRRVELATMEPGHAGGIEEERGGVFGHSRAAREGVAQAFDALFIKRKTACNDALDNAARPIVPVVAAMDLAFPMKRPPALFLWLLPLSGVSL